MDGTVELADGGHLAFEDVGDGPVVLFLHPGLWDMRTWDPQVASFVDAGYRVIRYDQRGFGQSSWPEATYSSVADALALLDTRGVASAALVGCSMGGATATQLVIEHPERAWALVPVASGCPGYPWDEEEEALLFEPIERAVDAGDLTAATDAALAVWAAIGTDDPIGQRIREIALENTAQFQLDEALDVWERYPTYEHLEEIDVPTLVVVGDTDVRDIERVADVLATRIPSARKVLIEHADHVVNMRQPAAFDAAVLAFLERSRP
ncbi:MAG TPA: alpha/beta hydrolase [Actinomycetota bacterium]|nr:alpha/beta hydrolase [Actinomycetota bacterium]